MGKKHKKHRGEKGPEPGLAGGEYIEKPLKLVLKVGGGEVKELSASRLGHDPSFYEDRLEHEKHKDKKKKKKKKEDKLVVEDKKKVDKIKMEKKKDGKKKEDRKKEDKKKKTKSEKKKKDRGYPDSEGDTDLMLHSPLRLDSPHLKLSKPEEEPTPLQEALNQLMRQLQRKDPSAFFSFPVTDFIAPGYSMIIKNPMDFSTIREKIRNNEYQSIEELKDNFKQICHNAMIYNKPETIYHKAAKKLLNSGMKILSQERIQSLKQSIDFMLGVPTNGKPKDPNETQVMGDAKNDATNFKEESVETEDVKSFKIHSKDHKRKEKDPLEEKLRNDLLAAREQELIDLIIRQSAGKLTRRVVNSELEFERRRSDGTTTLGVIISSDPVSDFGCGLPKIGITAGKLHSGVNTLQGFKEDKRNKVTPVSYLNYGPFSTYAPDYDSTFANIGKDDSDLIYTTYGEEPNLQDDLSVEEFLAKTQDHPYGMADCLLDAFTKGGHSRSLRQLEMVIDTDTEQLPLSRRDPCSNNNGRFASLSTVSGFELAGEPLGTEAAQIFQRKLDETTLLIRELQGAQNERLSSRPPPNTVCLLGPSYKEMHLADRVTSNLKELSQQVTPGDIVSVQGLRKAMGISIPFSASEDSFIDLTTEACNKDPLQSWC
ncbi:bromodomain-containing protein 7 isoform X2 [Ambystoma mexicanum]|uniref:bromodomain-containing protein 7 isoform X2 n=1 Tax=Ambystoma mexicanum TaxID=8296 RepID=UPI0037E77DB8